MNLVNQRKTWPLRLIVLLLLVSAQSFSLAHEVIHVPYSDNGVLCEVCSAGHGLGSGVTVVYVVANNPCVHYLQVVEPRADHYQTDPSPYISRAPPLNDVF